MILETKKLWFKKLQIFLEDKLPSVKELENEFDSVMIISHKKLDLPNWRVREKDTALIDLTLPEDDIFRRFSDTTRNEIRKTYNNSDLNFLFNSDFEKSYELYFQFEKAQGRRPVDKVEIKNFKLALAYFRGDAIYGFYIIESFPYARIRSIFSKRLTVTDKEMLKIISNSGRRLLWEIVRDLKRRGFVFLDVGSARMENPKTVNITKFKLSFGGDIVKEYNYMYNSTSFRRIMNVKNFFANIYKRTL